MPEKRSTSKEPRSSIASLAYIAELAAFVLLVCGLGVVLTGIGRA